MDCISVACLSQTKFDHINPRIGKLWACTFIIMIHVLLLPPSHAFQSLSTWFCAHLTAARAACGAPGKPLSFKVSAMSMKGTTKSVPGPPYSVCKKSLKISVQIPTTSSIESPNISFFDSLFSRWFLNFSVSASANSGMGSGNLYSAALQMSLGVLGLLIKGFVAEFLKPILLLHKSPNLYQEETETEIPFEIRKG